MSKLKNKEMKECMITQRMASVVIMIVISCLMHSEVVGGQGSLYAAVHDGDMKKAITLINTGAQLDGGFYSDEVPLCIAATRGNLHMVRMLLEHGANPNKQENIFLATPLHEVMHIVNNDTKYKIVKTLLEHGANPNIKDRDGKTPLVRAAYYHDEPTVRLLLQYGAENKIKDGEDDTALSLVQKYYNADKHNQSGKQWEPILKTLKAHHYETIGKHFSLLDQDTIAMYVQEPIFDPMPLAHSAYFSSDSMVKLLVQYGAEKKIRYSAGDTTLSLVQSYYNRDKDNVSGKQWEPIVEALKEQHLLFDQDTIDTYGLGQFLNQKTTKPKKITAWLLNVILYGLSLYAHKGVY